MTQKLAIFDIDGTIFRSSLLVALVEELVESHLFPEEARDLYAKEYDEWRNREGEYGIYIEKVVNAFRIYTKGIHYSKVAESAERVAEREGKRTYQYTRDLLKELKESNFFLLAISQSPKFMVDGFCVQYGFDKVYGSLYEIGPQNLFTGEQTDFHLVANKANIVKRVLEKEDVTLDGSIGVGDTQDDISFLESVEQPICFNPSRELYTYAKRMDWRVIVERKDVVYTIQ